MLRCLWMVSLGGLSQFCLPGGTYKSAGLFLAWGVQHPDWHYEIDFNLILVVILAPCAHLSNSTNDKIEDSNRSYMQVGLWFINTIVAFYSFYFWECLLDLDLIFMLFVVTNKSYFEENYFILLFTAGYPQ